MLLKIFKKKKSENFMSDFFFQIVSLAVKVRRNIRKKAVVRRVVGVPLPLEYQVTVNQKKVHQRKHLELLRKGRRSFVWF